MLIYVQILGLAAMELQTIENLPKKYLMFHACGKDFFCKNNISIKNTLIWIEKNFPLQRLLWEPTKTYFPWT